jgi:hypothetical protein
VQGLATALRLIEASHEKTRLTEALYVGRLHVDVFGIWSVRDESLA